MDLMYNAIVPPTFSPIPYTHITYVSTSRSTVCDILCTTNTPKAKHNHLKFQNQKKHFSISISFPYEKVKAPDLSKGETKPQNLKLNELRHIRSEELKKDRLEYFEKLNNERIGKELLRQSSATLIQSLFRGFHIRKKRIGNSYKIKRRCTSILSQLEIQDELCTMAASLSLKPIEGLNLESRTKTSKRRSKIEIAASFRMQRFFKMLVAQRKALIEVQKRRNQRVQKSAIVLTKAFRLIGTKNFGKRKDTTKRYRMAIKIQAKVRAFLASFRVRILINNKRLSARHNEAATIIQRNTLKKLERIRIRKYRTKEEREAEEKLIDDLAEQSVDDIISRTMEHVMADALDQAVVDEKLRMVAMETERIAQERQAMENNLEALKQIESEPQSNQVDRKPSVGLVEVPETDSVGVSSTSLEEDPNESSEVSFWDENSPDFNLKESVSEFVDKIYQKAVTNLCDVSTPDSDILVQEAVQEVVMDMIGNVIKDAVVTDEPSFATGLEEDTLFNDTNGDSVTSAINPTTIDETSTVDTHALEEHVTSMTSFIEMVENKDSIENDQIIRLQEQPSVATSVELVEAIDHREKIAVSTVPYYTTGIQALSFTEQELMQIESNIRKAKAMELQGEYLTAGALLDETRAILFSQTESEQKHPQYILLLSTIDLMRANNLYLLAFYSASKSILDEVYEERFKLYTTEFVAEQQSNGSMTSPTSQSTETTALTLTTLIGLSKLAYLLAEVLFYRGEWYRSQAIYTEAERHLAQAYSLTCLQLPESSETASEAEDGSPDEDILILHSKILIGHAELFRNSGQYFKGNSFLELAKASLKTNKDLGMINFEIHGDYTTCALSYLILQGNYDGAQAALEELLENRRTYYGNEHPKVATSLARLGFIYMIRNKFGEAQQMFDECLQIRAKVYPPDHPAIADALFRKAQYFDTVGLFRKSIAAFERCLEMRMRIFQPLTSSHPCICSVMTARSAVLMKYGEIQTSYIGLDEALRIQRDLFITELHRDIGESLHHMGVHAIRTGKYNDAIATLEQALKVKQNLMVLYNPEWRTHPSVELTRCHLAHAYSLVYKIEDSKAILKDSIKSLRHLVGYASMEVALPITYLGTLCKIRANYSDAKALFSMSYIIVNDIFDPEYHQHPLVTISMLQSADNYRLPGFFPEALNLCNSALKIRMKIFGEENLLTIEAFYLKSLILRDSGKWDEAEKMLNRILKYHVESYGEKSAHYASCLVNLAECYRMQGKLLPAGKLFIQAISLQNELFGSDSGVVAETSCYYATWLIDDRSFEEAYSLLSKSVIPCLNQVLGPGHPLTVYAQANLAMCLTNHDATTLGGEESVSNVSGATDLMSLYNKKEIFEFLNFSKNISFNSQHPWVLRFMKGLGIAGQSYIIQENPTQLPPSLKNSDGKENRSNLNDTDSLQYSLPSHDSSFESELVLKEHRYDADYPYPGQGIGIAEKDRRPVSGGSTGGSVSALPNPMTPGGAGSVGGTASVNTSFYVSDDHSDTEMASSALYTGDRHSEEGDEEDYYKETSSQRSYHDELMKGSARSIYTRSSVDRSSVYTPLHDYMGYDESIGSSTYYRQKEPRSVGSTADDSSSVFFSVSDSRTFQKDDEANSVTIDDGSQFSSQYYKRGDDDDQTNTIGDTQYDSRMDDRTGDIDSLYSMQSSFRSVLPYEGGQHHLARDADGSIVDSQTRDGIEEEGFSSVVDTFSLDESQSSMLSKEDDEFDEKMARNHPPASGRSNRTGDSRSYQSRSNTDNSATRSYVPISTDRSHTMDQSLTEYSRSQMSGESDGQSLEDQSRGGKYDEDRRRGKRRDVIDDDESSSYDNSSSHRYSSHRGGGGQYGRSSQGSSSDLDRRTNYTNEEEGSHPSSETQLPRKNDGVVTAKRSYMDDGSLGEDNISIDEYSTEFHSVQDND